MIYIPANEWSGRWVAASMPETPSFFFEAGLRCIIVPLVNVFRFEEGAAATRPVVRTEHMSNSDASDAFPWLDANAESLLEAPDEAFDWVFMLTPHDWTLVDSVWAARSPLWREAFSYIVVDGPINESRKMLLRAVRDPDGAVAQQAAISLCHQFVEYPDDRVSIDDGTVTVIRELIARLGAANMDPVPKFLAGLA